MKKMFFILILLQILVSPKSAEAHILKIDRTIGAILHINPEDDPIAGDPSHFHLDFTDKTDQFSPEKCLCTVDIYQKDKKLYSLKLQEQNPDPSLNGISFMYTFPKKEIYKVVLTGEPKNPNAFQPFSLTYDVRVGREADKLAISNISDNSTAAIITLLGGAGIFLVLMYIIRRDRSKNAS